MVHHVRCSCATTARTMRAQRVLTQPPCSALHPCTTTHARGCFGLRYLLHLDPLGIQRCDARGERLQRHAALAAGTSSCAICSLTRQRSQRSYSVMRSHPTLPHARARWRCFFFFLLIRGIGPTPLHPGHTVGHPLSAAVAATRNAKAPAPASRTEASHLAVDGRVVGADCRATGYSCPTSTYKPHAISRDAALAKWLSRDGESPSPGSRTSTLRSPHTAAHAPSRWCAAASAWRNTLPTSRPFAPPAP